MKKEVLRLTKGTIPPIGKYEHGVPFDSDCGECMEEQAIMRAGRRRSIYADMYDEAKRICDARDAFHPLKNPDSKHYQMVDGVEAIERLEQMYSKEELMAWAKISAMKYRLRISRKDAVEKEAVKIKGFEAYYTYLKESIDAQTPPNSSL